jgi:hypothetical protein
MSDTVFEGGLGRLFVMVFKSSDGYWKTEDGKTVPFLHVRRNHQGGADYPAINIVVGAYSIQFVWDRAP